ncbi:hypothetical protein V2J09_016659 [Rumex salicifolius]
MGHVEMQPGICSNGDVCNDETDMSSKLAAIACSINTEIGTVLAVMRRNVRWGGLYMAGDNQLEHSLIQSLKALRKQIFSSQNQWQNITPLLYLQPFLDVIVSDETGAPITGVALSSVYKILTLDVFSLNTVSIKDAIHSIVDAVTSCRFEVTDPASEEVVLMKILQVLLACMKNKASSVLSNLHVCIIVDTCFRVVHQAGTKSELLQRIARQTMHELIRCVFSRLPEVEISDSKLNNVEKPITQEIGRLNYKNSYTSGQFDGVGFTSEKYSASLASSSLADMGARSDDETPDATEKDRQADVDDSHLMKLPYGVPCMVEILHFLCSLLNVAEHVGMVSKPNTLSFDEDVPLFALGLINSAIELGGSTFCRHPRLLSLIQDDVFRHLMQFGLSMSPLILSMVCSIVLNMYHHLRTKLKLQIEFFFSSVILRVSQSRFGASYQQQEVAMEALVDFCRQNSFMMEMFANFDCDISGSNVFEDLVNLLSKSAFPVNSPLSAMHILALDGLVALVQGMAKRTGDRPLGIYDAPTLKEFMPFWMIKCDDYSDPRCWVPFVCQMRYIKRQLMVSADHFNHGPKKGFEFLQAANLLPKELDAKSVACFFRYTTGLDKNIIGDFLGNHDHFCVQVLHDFARTFNFQDMSLDTALRLFLETFRLPGESQKIQRVLEAFSERYYEQAPQILANKDAALLLSYSLIMLNTDQHNAQVKKKMSEEDFIRNNRCINGGKDLPREFLTELYHSICKNEIRLVAEEGTGFPDITSSRWMYIMHKCENAAPYIVLDNRPYLDQDMFAIVAGPTIAAISVVFDHTEDDNVYQTCIDGFLAVAKIAAFYHIDSVLDDLVLCLTKFTGLLNPTYLEEFLLSFAEDSKARMAMLAVFTIANKYGDCIRSSWKNILECILRLHEYGLLFARVTNETTDDAVLSAEPGDGKSVINSSATGLPKKSSGFIGRFSQLLSFDSEEVISQPSEEEVAARQCASKIVQKCQINNIFFDSKFLQADSLIQLARAIMAAGQALKETDSSEDETGGVFCLDLLIGITLNNRDRISLLWQDVYEHISNIVQSTVMPCTLVEKAIFGLLSICQRLLPYKENLVDELLKSLQLVLKLDARVADAYCEQITQEVGRLIKANATRIRTQMGWRIVLSLLAITARHPEASEVGFEALSFIMGEGAFLLPSNFSLCVDATRQFAESRVGQVERSVHALDLMGGSVSCLVRWAQETKGAMTKEEEAKMSQKITEMWLRLVQALRKSCLDNREEVRNQAMLSMQKCLMGVHEIHLPCSLWFECFDSVILTLLDELLEMASHKNLRNIDATLILAMKLLTKVFLLSIEEVAKLSAFSKLWLDVLIRMENFMKVKIRGKRSEKLQEIVPELLKNTLLVMKSGGLLVTGDSFWELTWLHVNNISPSLQSQVFPKQGTHEEAASSNPAPLAVERVGFLTIT